MATCSKRVGKGAIAYPCVVEVPAGLTEHPGPCAAIENPASMAARQRWDAAAPARAQLAAHQSQPLTFADSNPVHTPTPVPGSGLQPAEHRQVHKPVVGGFGEEPVAEPPCPHPYELVGALPDGAIGCALCGERLKEPESTVPPQEGTLREFVQTHQAPPEVAVARANEGAAQATAAAAASQVEAQRIAAPPGVDPGLVEAAVQGDPEAQERLEQVAPGSLLDGAEPFPGAPAGGFVMDPSPPPTRDDLVPGVRVVFLYEGGGVEGRIVPSDDLPLGTVGVQLADDSIWAVQHQDITSVLPPDPEPSAVPARGSQLADQARPEPTKQRPGDQVLPQASDRPIAHEQMADDLGKRLRVGIERYGQPLRPMNGRDTIQDAYEEALDLGVYLKTLANERAEVLARFERAYSGIVTELAGVSGALSGPLAEDLDAVLAWLRGAPIT